MPFNPDIHHRRSIRLAEYDYSQAGAYFVTVCAWQRDCLFGEIIDGEMVLNFLRGAGFDVLWIPDYDCHLDDASLLKLAFDENRIIITNDKDFGELNFLQRKPSVGIILFRIDEQNVRVKITILKNMLLKYPEKFSNHFVVIARKRIRFISMEKIL